MGLSRGEIEDIARECAQKILENLHRYAVEYKEPQSIGEGLRDSMVEEKTAFDWYHRRGTDALLKGDKETADLYGHIAREEDEHYQEFQERLSNLKPKPKREDVEIELHGWEPPFGFVAFDKKTGEQLADITLPEEATGVSEEEALDYLESIGAIQESSRQGGIA
jgi:rubrerythrin